MTERLALKIANTIKRIEPNQTPSVEILKFSLEFLLNSLFTFLVISAIGIVTGSFWQTLSGLVAFVLLRFFSGGMHFSKAMHCSLVTTALIAAAPHIPLPDLWLYIMIALSAILVLIFAPSNIEGHARIPKKYFPLLKIISVGIILLNLLVLRPEISIVHFIQALTTITIKRRCNI